MKKIITLLSLLFFVLYSISYSLNAQAVILALKDKDGKAVEQKEITLNIKIKGAADTVLVSKSITATTGDYGVLNLDLTEDIKPLSSADKLKLQFEFEADIDGETINVQGLYIPVPAASTAEESMHAEMADMADVADMAFQAMTSETSHFADIAGTATHADHALAADDATNAQNAEQANSAFELNPPTELLPGIYNIPVFQDTGDEVETNWYPFSIEDRSVLIIDKDSSGNLDIQQQKFPNTLSTLPDNITIPIAPGPDNQWFSVINVGVPPVDELIPSFPYNLEFNLEQLNMNIHTLEEGVLYKDPETGRVFEVMKVILRDGHLDGPPQIDYFLNEIVPTLQPLWRKAQNDVLVIDGDTFDLRNIRGSTIFEGGSVNSQVNFRNGLDKYSFMGDQFICALGFFQFSDIGLKHNISDLGTVSSKLAQLNPVTYNMNHGSGEEIGFLAQDMEKILPELVKEVDMSNTGSDFLIKGKKKVVNYTGLIPVLTKALQEHQELISSQQKQIDELKALVSDLVEQTNSR